MTRSEILAHRLHNHHLTGLRFSTSRFSTPSEVVGHLGALQAQDYAWGLWSVGVRLPGGAAEAVERAIEDRRIVRTWPMRGTLHLVAAGDVRWMLDLMAARVIAGRAGMFRRIGLTDDLVARSRGALRGALAGGRRLPRPAVARLLQSEGIPAGPNVCVVLIAHLCMEGLLCTGPRAGSDNSYVLLDEWCPPGPRLSRPAAVAEAVRRYFTSHGPATVKDFVGWSGLTVADARSGIAAAGDGLETVTDEDSKTYWMARGSSPPLAEPTAFLLPAFDEYVLGYKERDVAIDPDHSPKIVPGRNGVFLPTVVVDGRIEGTWKREQSGKKVIVTVTRFGPISKVHAEILRAEAECYGAFVGAPLELRMD